MAAVPFLVRGCGHSSVCASPPAATARLVVLRRYQERDGGRSLQRSLSCPSLLRAFVLRARNPKPQIPTPEPEAADNPPWVTRRVAGSLAAMELCARKQFLEEPPEVELPQDGDAARSAP